jgi:transcription-repair coupling factor (superfamily II helicase)
MNLHGLLPLVAESLSTARVRVAAGDRFVLGAPDGAKPAVVAALAAGRTVLVVAGRPDRAEAFVDELAAWCDDTERVLFFPESDAIPYERAAVDTEAEQRRLALLQSLHHWTRAERPIIVAPAMALAQRTIAPDDLNHAAEAVRVGARLAPDPFLRRLEKLGYRFEPLVETVGQAARRGGIVDIFPPDAVLPVRIEFLGDHVESLRRFHPATQRTSELITAVEVGPAREAQPDPARVAELRATLDFSTVELGLRPRLEDELAMLERGEARGAGLYTPFLLHATLLDHLPADTLVITDEARDLALLLDELDHQAAEARAQLEAAGRLPRGLPLPHAAREQVMAAVEERRPGVDLQRWAMGEAGEALTPHGGTRSEEGGTREDGREALSSFLAPHSSGAEGPVLAGKGPGVRTTPTFSPTPAFGGRLRSVVADVMPQIRGGRRVVIVSQQSARLAELFEAEGLTAAPVSSIEAPPAPGSLTLLHGSLAHGWTLDLPDGALALATDAEIFGFTKQRRAVRPRASGREAFLAGLTPGDLVVHIEHGIARFAGLVRRRMPADSAPGTQQPARGTVEREYLELRYAEGDRLFVPTEQVDRVDRYVGPSDHAPQLTRLGSGEWSRTKERVRRAVGRLAIDLLQLYAERELKPGHAYTEDTPWQQEMEAAFPYVETPDQLAALREIKSDMEQPRPMDRVVIGDVGYGKTELAVRAAFKAVMDGRQVGVLVPTTVLAQQHLQTFTERVSGFPVRVDVLSRFRSDAEARQVLEDLAAGTVDILIGTHRMLQKDVQFKDLGLVIIDEEQRFGVAHKERLKQLRSEVDVLTLSATPIPRTLHMSLSGIRDMSTMATAPEDRLPVKTFVSEWDDHLIREAILREMDRGGQIYFVHNRVHTIELLARRLRDLVPEAELTVGHGQMPEEMLERNMLAFQKGECDILLCTTIIESGLDIPNVNTIIINQANKLGLSQLYQLRGRVGRGAHRAFAYLLYDKNTALTETAQKRLQTIFEATELGAGFQIALRDLEIRGAGNLLGAEQSGHIGAVGYELYARMLGEAVARMRALQRGETPPPPPPAPITVDLPLTAHIPEAYIPDLNLRLSLYQRLGTINDRTAVDDAAAELTDRFGAPPPALRNLLDVVRVKALARAAGLTSVTLEDGVIVLRAPQPVEHRDRLHGAFGEGVQVGSTQVRIEQRGDWRGTLLAVLEILADLPPQPTCLRGKGEARSAAVDFGTFAAPPPRAQRRDGASDAVRAPARPARDERGRRSRRPGRRPRR